MSSSSSPARCVAASSRVSWRSQVYVVGQGWAGNAVGVDRVTHADSLPPHNRESNAGAHTPASGVDRRRWRRTDRPRRSLCVRLRTAITCGGAHRGASTQPMPRARRLSEAVGRRHATPGGQVVPRRSSPDLPQRPPRAHVRHLRGRCQPRRGPGRSPGRCTRRRPGPSLEASKRPTALRAKPHGPSTKSPTGHQAEVAAECSGLERPALSLPARPNRPAPTTRHRGRRQAAAECSGGSSVQIASTSE